MMQTAGLLLAKVEWHFDGFDDWNYPGTLVLVILVAGAVVISLAHATSSTSPPEQKTVPSLSNLVVEADGPDNLAVPRAAFAGRDRARSNSGEDRRVWVRREGIALEIEVADAKLSQPPIPGTVLNRSRGGLLVAVPQPTAKGTILSVRPPHAPEEQAWIQVEVRHCKQRDDRWLLGCKFTEQLPWSVLLLFG
jgi:hypothetical protein